MKSTFKYTYMQMKLMFKQRNNNNMWTVEIHINNKHIQNTAY